MDLSIFTNEVLDNKIIITKSLKANTLILNHGKMYNSKLNLSPIKSADTIKKKKDEKCKMILQINDNKKSKGLAFSNNNFFQNKDKSEEKFIKDDLINSRNKNIKSDLKSRISDIISINDKSSEKNLKSSLTTKDSELDISNMKMAVLTDKKSLILIDDFKNNLIKNQTNDINIDKIEIVSSDLSLLNSLIKISNNNVKYEKIEFKEKDNNGNSLNKIKVCKICYETEDSNDNKFISPCLCQGSMKFIHENCLKMWIENNIDKPAICEICKYNYKMKFLFEYKLSHEKMWIFLKNILAIIMTSSIILSLLFIISYYFFAKYFIFLFLVYVS